MATKEIAIKNARYITRRNGKPMAIFKMDKGWFHTETSPKITQSLFLHPIQNYQMVKLEEDEND